VDFCDSEIPLNGIDQAYSPEGLKIIGYTALMKIIVPAIITGSLMDRHLLDNDIDPFEPGEYYFSLLTNGVSKMRATFSRQLKKISRQ